MIFQRQNYRQRISHRPGWIHFLAVFGLWCVVIWIFYFSAGETSNYKKEQDAQTLDRYFAASMYSTLGQEQCPKIAKWEKRLTFYRTKTDITMVARAAHRSGWMNNDALYQWFSCRTSFPVALAKV